MAIAIPIGLRFRLEVKASLITFYWSVMFVSICLLILKIMKPDYRFSSKKRVSFGTWLLGMATAFAVPFGVTSAAFSQTDYHWTKDVPNRVEERRDRIDDRIEERRDQLDDRIDNLPEAREDEVRERVEERQEEVDERIEEQRDRADERRENRQEIRDNFFNPF